MSVCEPWTPRCSFQLTKFTLLTLTLLLTFRRSAQGLSLGAQVVCEGIPGLSQRQRAMCRTAPDAVAAIGDGVRLGYEECKNQLAGHRWNCSGIGDGEIFGHFMFVASREAAFTYAITSAGVTYALTAACSRGNISACGCHNGIRNSKRQDPTSDFKWGGCSADVGYGIRFARKFMDAREVDHDDRRLMNLHNNRVGRKIVKSLLKLDCKCHGVSGSCAVKTCWHALPPFREIGMALLKKYRRASAVIGAPRSHARRHIQQLLVTRSHAAALTKRAAVPKKMELVYLEPSPNYCERNLSVGSYGTTGRICKRTSKGEDGCEHLCCGRGYNTRQYTKKSQCRCKFKWCCKVECDICIEQRLDYTCK